MTHHAHHNGRQATFTAPPNAHPLALLALARYALGLDAETGRGVEVTRA